MFVFCIFCMLFCFLFCISMFISCYLSYFLISRFSYFLVFFYFLVFYDPLYRNFDISASFRATDHSDISRFTCTYLRAMLSNLADAKVCVQSLGPYSPVTHAQWVRTFPRVLFSVHVFRVMHLYMTFLTFSHLSWTGQCGDVDDCSEANNK